MTILSFQQQGYTSPLEIWLEYCVARGLTPDILQPMGGELLTLEAASKILGNGIFWYKQFGGIGAFVYPVAEGEHQARVLFDPKWQAPIPAPGGDMKKGKLAKYYRPKGSVNVLYIPPHLTDWYNPDSIYDLLIVEGALNAVRLASAGYHAVAIQGVENWHIGNKTTPMIPELLRLIEAKQVKRVVVMYDSDSDDPVDKRTLWVAKNKICQEIMRIRQDRRDTVFTCSPPAKPSGDKNGPDDYLQAKGVDEFNRLLREEAKRYDDNPYLQLEQKYLERFIYDEESGQMYDCNIRSLIKKEHADMTMATGGQVDDILSPRLTPTVYSTKRLLVAPGMRIARGMRFRPDTDEQYFQDESGLYRVNKFNPDNIPKPIKGDVSIAMEMLRSLCRDSPSAIQKILIVAARHAQNPAKTPKLALLFTGEPGSGKSNMARLIGLSLSKDFTDVKVDFKSSFNSYWRSRACKEWAEFDRHMDAEWLKDLITSESYEVITKYGSNYVENNYTLNIFTHNGLQSNIQEGDRRFIIAGYSKPDDKRLGLAFEEWVRGPGPSYFRHYLLNDVDCSEYDSMSTYTEMRDTIIDASKSYKATVKDMVMADLEDIPGLACAPNVLFTALLEPHRVNTISFMKEHGQDFIKPGLESVKIGGVATRFRAFKDHAFWKSCTDTDAYREQYKIAEAYLEKTHLNRKF